MSEKTAHESHAVTLDTARLPLTVLASSMLPVSCVARLVLFQNWTGNWQDSHYVVPSDILEH